MRDESDLTQATCIIVDGPYSGGISADISDEIPEWVVALCDDDGSDIEIHSCATYESALELGKLLAREMKIELVIEAMRA